MCILNIVAEKIITNYISDTKKAILELYTVLSKDNPNESTVNKLQERLNTNIQFLKSLREQLNPLSEYDLSFGRGLTVMINDANQALELIHQHYSLKRSEKFNQLMEEVLRSAPTEADISAIRANLEERQVSLQKRQAVINQMFENQES